MFRSGREFAAWLGLVPRQNSTGGKTRLGRTSRQGNALHPPPAGHWRAVGLVLLQGHQGQSMDPGLAGAKRPRLVVAVALANKMARIAWALMARQTTYQAAAAA